MKRIRFEDYFDEISDVLTIFVVCVPISFFIGWIIYGISRRVLRALEKPSPDHLYWRIMLVLGAILVALLLVYFFYCLFCFILELLRRTAIRRKCKTCGHDWDALLHCRRCEEVKLHDHEWDGCRCSLCGEVRNEGHNWDGCRCTLCGEIRSEGHIWNGCKCVRCGTTRDEGHDWIEYTCPNCDGSGFVTPVGTSYSYGDPGYGYPDYQEPCQSHHPSEYECRICGRRTSNP